MNSNSATDALLAMDGARGSSSWRFITHFTLTENPMRTPLFSPLHGGENRSSMK